MRQLGWTPTRRLALRTEEVGKNDLHPASSIFVPLPSSSTHYFMAKLGLAGVSCELIKLVRVQGDKGFGAKLVVSERIPLDLSKMRSRRDERAKGASETAMERLSASGCVDDPYGMGQR
jgi:mediator of RNA polymerase II transcription subunit 14